MYVLLLHSLPAFLDLLALVILFGVLSCHLWVLPKGGIREGRGPEQVAGAGLSRLLGGALALITVTSFLLLIVRATEMSRRPLSALPSVLPTVLLQTHYGLVWWVRLGALLALGVGWWALKRTGRTSIAVLMFGAAAVVAWFYSATGHAADRGDFTLAQWTDWVHVLAVSLWGGSILAVTLAVRPVFVRQPEVQRDFIAGTFQRLSTLAGIALAAVLLSGIYNTVLRLSAVSDLWSTPYGRILSTKLLLVLAMIGLSVGNRYLNLPHLRRWGGDRTAARWLTGWVLRIVDQRLPELGSRPGSELVRRFLRLVAMEALLVVAVLACVALLIHSAPPHRMPHPMHQPAPA